MKRSLSPESEKQKDRSPKSIRTALRKSIESKQQQKAEALATCELLKQKRRDEERLLKSWQSNLDSAGFFTEILTLDDDHGSPFLRSNEEPFFALAIRRSKSYCFNPKTGPFRAAQLIVYANCEWQLQCPAVEEAVIKSGKFDNSNLREKELTDLAKNYLTTGHTLCPGLPSAFKNVQVELGYLPQTVQLENGFLKTLRSKKCKIWHVPHRNPNRNDRNPVEINQKICSECMIALRYVEKQLKKKRDVKGAKKLQRQLPSSNYPLKFLSPKSKRGRFQNQRLQRSRLQKRVKKLYNNTKIELPESQSQELCALIEAIESTAEGQKELNNIAKEGNNVSKEGVRAGDCVREVWNRDKETFFKDQRKNGE